MSVGRTIDILPDFETIMQTRRATTRATARARMPARAFRRDVAGPLVDLLLPERCAACAATAGHGPWEPPGLVVQGLRPWDRPHLCVDCATRIFAQPCARILDGRGRHPDLCVWAAAATSALLTQVVGAFKYHGLRGLAWPLGRALAAAAVAAPPSAGAVPPQAARACADVLVPVPLHAARRRSRGFNQAAVLADLAGRVTGLSVDNGALARTRATAQQAKLSGSAARERNLAGAFAARPTGVPRRALVVDDLVTAGATAQAAAAALRSAGWEVAGVLALGLALSRDGDDDGDGDADF